MEIDITNTAKNDLLSFKQSGNKALMEKIEQLLRAIAQTPYTGIGKPERLKHNLAGNWSRRINQEHRIVYDVNESKQLVTILSMRGHYEKII